MSLFHKSQASQPGRPSSCRQLPSTFLPQPRREEIPNSALPAAIITWGGERGANHYTIQKVDVESNWASLLEPSTRSPFTRELKEWHRKQKYPFQGWRLHTLQFCFLLVVQQEETGMDCCPWLTFLRTSLKRMWKHLTSRLEIIFRLYSRNGNASLGGN